MVVTTVDLGPDTALYVARGDMLAAPCWHCLHSMMLREWTMSWTKTSHAQDDQLPGRPTACLAAIRTAPAIPKPAAKGIAPHTPAITSAHSSNISEWP